MSYIELSLANIIYIYIYIYIIELKAKVIIRSRFYVLPVGHPIRFLFGLVMSRCVWWFKLAVARTWKKEKLGITVLHNTPLGRDRPSQLDRGRITTEFDIELYYIYV